MPIFSEEFQEINQDAKGNPILEPQAIKDNNNRAIGLKVVILDDSNKDNQKEAKIRGETLIKQPDILGVVGHYRSAVTLAYG